LFVIADDYLAAVVPGLTRDLARRQDPWRYLAMLDRPGVASDRLVVDGRGDLCTGTALTRDLVAYYRALRGVADPVQSRAPIRKARRSMRHTG
jgi:hypothetical protein